ncbi:unnamed protein product [Gulo gulo]|uniref:Uncharacterized protein n=1 Tax=Gulo gulo TaxID=48420 RepID=A0A9X9PTX8_GULGU|nr:unnamed protein product [Gulo gulo]
MTRPVGTATWVGAAEGERGGAPMSWMGSEGLAGVGSPVFGAVLAARPDWPELRCSRSPSRPPFHILRRRRGQSRRRLFTSCVEIKSSGFIDLALPLLMLNLFSPQQNEDSCALP